jgi:hypothetical protein
MRLAVVFLSLALAGCSRSNLGQQAPEASVPATHDQLSLSWADGVVLAAGQRTAISADGSGWLVTQPFEDDSLALTRIAPSDGVVTGSVVLTPKLARYSGVGLAADAAGHLWIAYGESVARLDENALTLATWPLPASPPDAAPSDERPAAGNVVAAAWDPSAQRLLLVRDGDHRLYSWDPSTAKLAIVTDLPITTSPISRMTSAADGQIAITGTLTSAASFTPTTIDIDSSGKVARSIESATSACWTSQGLALLTTAGEVKLWAGTAARSLATVDAPRGRTTFACDDMGFVFETAVTPGTITVTRLSPDGGQQTATGALTAVNGSRGGPGGSTPSAGWADPALVGLLPDGTGGVWLVSESGTQSSMEATPNYPSLTHVSFPP